jgi:hypothetical protein
MMMVYTHVFDYASIAPQLRTQRKRTLSHNCARSHRNCAQLRRSERILTQLRRSERILAQLWRILTQLRRSERILAQLWRNVSHFPLC